MVLAETTAMGGFLATMSEVASWIFSQITTIGSTIMNTPFFLVTTGVMLGGAAIGIFGRLLSKS